MTMASDEEIKATAEAYLAMPATDAAKEMMRGDKAGAELPPEHFAALNQAVGWLSHFANMDCECERVDGDGKIRVREPEDPDNHCATCAAQQAIERILRVTEPQIETLHPERTRGKSMAEKIYLDTWREENARKQWQHGGNMMIDGILNPDLSKPAPRVSPRDSKLIATFVQWLGTNCGRAFIEKCERRIEQDRACMRKIERFAAEAREPHHAEIVDAAKAIAAQWIQDVYFFSRAELQKQIIGLVMRYYGGRQTRGEQTTAGQRYFDIKEL